MEYLLIEILLMGLFYGIQKYYKVKIFRSRNQFIIFWFLVFLFGVIWDQYAVIRGHWIYPGTGTLRIFIGKIPLEDYLFMIVVPYGILTAYQVSNKMMDKRRKNAKRIKD